MQFSSLLTFAFFALVGLITASPAQGGSRLRRRSSGEVVYLVNCGGATVQSQINYYASGTTQSGDGEQPDAVAEVCQNQLVIWEGKAISGAFPNGTYFTSYILANGMDVGNFNFAGNGSSSVGTHFNCYKDRAGNPNLECYSIYYCEDVKSCGAPSHAG